MNDETIKRAIQSSIKESYELYSTIKDTCIEGIEEAAVEIRNCLRNDGKILLFGNGGSAADAQHITAEFMCRFSEDRSPLCAIALTTNTSLITAISNDYGFDHIFSRQIEALGKQGDIVVAISTSGLSPNVIAGIKQAKEAGLFTIGLTREDDNLLAGMVDVAIAVPSQKTPRIQECHILIGHLLCEAVELLLYSSPQRDEHLVRGNIHCATGSSKEISWDALLAFRERWRNEGRVVVWTNGCFDLLHAGHVRSLRDARGLGDILVVGLNSDGSVRSLKGEGRPIMSQSERMEVLSAIEYIDYIVIFEELTPESSLSRLKPDIHCKGADYEPAQGKPMPEAPIVQSYGGRIEILPLYGSGSTSDIIDRIRSSGH